MAGGEHVLAAVEKIVLASFTSTGDRRSGLVAGDVDLVFPLSRRGQ